MVSKWQNHERWWAKEGDDLANAVWEIGTGLEKDGEERKGRALASLRLYDGRAGFDLQSGMDGSLRSEYSAEDLDYNLSRAGCDTVHAEIAGRQKPVAKFQTSGADWSTKRRAKKMEKFVRAVLHQQQGQFLNAWELQEAHFLDAAVWGMGVTKVFGKGGKIRMERHFGHELFVDPVEAIYGNPQNLFHVYYMEKDLAIKCFTDDESLSSEERLRMIAAIEAAGGDEDERRANVQRVVQRIKIVEAWRLPHGYEGDTLPGKHAFAIENKLLYEEDWDRPDFPFVITRWEADRIGWGAKGLVEQGASMHREVNYNAQKLQERFQLCGAKRTFYEEGSLDPQNLESNEAEVFIPIKVGRQIPKESSPKPIADAEMMWLNDCFQKYFEVLGISQMRASARKEPGVTAGVAIRTLNDMQTARFALKAKSYENSYVQLAKQIIWCARELGRSYRVRYDEEIKWSEVDIPEDTFDITIAPTSSLPNDPAGRMQMTQELYSAGIINSETYKQLLGWPDLEKEMDHQTSQRRWVEKVIDRMLDDGTYEPPDGHLVDKQGALLQISQAYFEAMYDDAPEENLSLLRDWMMEIDGMIAAGQEAAAMAAADMQAKIAEASAPPMQPGAGMPAAANRPPVAEGQQNAA